MTAKTADMPDTAAWIKKIGTPLVLLPMLAVQACLVGALWLWQLGQPRMIDPSEINVFAASWWWASGFFPYGRFAELPVLHVPWGPIYLWLSGALPSPAGLPYATGRLVSWVAIALTCVSVGVWVRLRTDNWRAATIAALLPLTAKPVIIFAALYRVDSLGVLFSVVGFAACTLFSGAVSLALAALFFAAAFGVKLTSVAAPIACIAFLWRRNRSRALWLTVAVGLLFPLAVGVMETASGGAYLFNARAGNVPSNIVKGLDMAARPLLSLPWLLGLVGALQLRRRAGVSFGPAAFYTASCFVTAVGFGLNPMSSWNYFIEFYMALALLTGELLGAGPVAISRESRRLTFWLVLNLALVIPSTVYWQVEHAREDREYSRSWTAAVEDLAGYVASGENVAVIDSQAGRDALNFLGRPSPVMVPSVLETRSVLGEAISRAVREGSVQRVLCGPELVECSDRFTGRD